MTFKISKWSIPQPQDPQNRKSLMGLLTSVNELAGTVGSRIQRAIRLGELLGAGLVKTDTSGNVMANPGGILNSVRATADARSALCSMTVGPSFHDGLLIHTDGQDVVISEGIATIPALGYPVQLLLPATVTIPSVNNQWYHLYLYVDAAGAAKVEAVTTAPSAPYYGFARSKTGDRTRRYIGSVRTDGSGVPLPFEMRGELVTYAANVTAAPYRVLTNGTNITVTAVDCSAVVPVSCRLAHMYFTNVGTAGIGFATGAGLTGTLSAVNPNQSIELEFPLDENQDFYYVCYVGVPPANGLYADVWGYTLER